MPNIESLLYELSRWFLLPVLIVICVLFVYALYAMGGFLTELVQRLLGSPRARPLHQLLRRHPDYEPADLDLAVLAELEWLRLASRAAPLLGLVATMIPMGPALAGVAAGDMMAVGEQVGIAFSAVIVALLAASLAFVVVTIKRRWRLSELREIERNGHFTREESRA